ncbi:hypothetical protein TruAng_007253 [Truncatella angustata]|nr:hypothetical protein TruAng_007253 [Truncatella angustata]
MQSISAELRNRAWRKDDYLVSTDSKLIPLPTLHAAFASSTLYWAKELPDNVMRETLDNSLCFGLYRLAANSSGEHVERQSADQPPISSSTTTDSDLVGFARCVTDYTTFLYLTDVWVNPSSQGNGLGKWLIACVQEVIKDMPHLRRSMLFTGDWERSVPFYEKIMDMSVLETKRGKGLAIMEMKGKGHSNYDGSGSAYQ